MKSKFEKVVKNYGRGDCRLIENFIFASLENNTFSVEVKEMRVIMERMNFL